MDIKIKPIEFHFEIFKKILKIQNMWPYEKWPEKVNKVLSTISLILIVHLCVVALLDLALHKPDESITDILRALVDCAILVIALIQVGLFRSYHGIFKLIEIEIENFRLPCQFQNSDIFTMDRLKYRYRILYWACLIFTFGVCSGNILVIRDSVDLFLRDHLQLLL